MYANRKWPERPPVEDEPALEAHLDRSGADAESRAFCHALARDGIAQIDLGPEGRALCDRVGAEMDEGFEARGVKRVQDAWLRSRAVHRLATLPKVRSFLRLAYGRPPFAFQTLNFRVGSEQHTHADTIHFHSLPERFMCGVWIALEDISAASGPLAYHAGSHKLPVLTMKAAGVNHPTPSPDDYGTVYLPALQQRLEAAGLPKTTVVLRKGEALVWAANLAHGGAPIVDPQSTRRSLVTHFFFKDCLYYTPLTSDVEDGRLSVRLPINLQTGFVEWPRIKGRFAQVSTREIRNAAAKLLLRRTYSA